MTQVLENVVHIGIEDNEWQKLLEGWEGEVEALDAVDKLQILVFEF